MRQLKDPIARINTLVKSWRATEPDRTFYGHTVTQFEVAAQPVFAVRDEAAELAKRVRANSARRKDVDVAALDLVAKIVNAIKADPAVGENSLLYAAMGYVRKADRYGRKRARPPVVAPPAGDPKPPEPSA